MMTDQAPTKTSTQSGCFTACRVLRRAASTDNTPADIHKTDLPKLASHTLSMHCSPVSVPCLRRSTASAIAWRRKCLKT